MDLFRDGAHVQLLSHVGGRILSADDDWLGVSALPLGRVAFLRTVWRVRYQTRNGVDSLLLQGAAYGRYLASSPDPPRSGDGRAAVQRCDSVEAVLSRPMRAQRYIGDSVEAVLWRPMRAQGSEDARLGHSQRYLRASHGEAVSVSTTLTDEDIRMTRWTVVPVDAAVAPPLPRLTRPPRMAAAAMNFFFRDGDFVRLERLASGDGFLYAHPDSLKVSLRRPGRIPFEATVWRVHVWHRDLAATFLMLQSAATGRYFGAVSESQENWRAAQCSYEAEDAHKIMWEPTSFLNHGRSPVVFISMRNVRHGYLRTDGIVTRWKVHCLNASSTPPPLPATELSANGRGFMVLQRTIRFVCADSEGHYPNTWSELSFKGSSIGRLREGLADRLKVKPEEIVLCLHCGSFGRLTPLVFSLPRSTERMDIVVLGANTTAALRLEYPTQERNR